jgi:CheY-like chemotaxis protein/anti-sigma regulatory factor (Ser/Thr protein kinase)
MEVMRVIMDAVDAVSATAEAKQVTLTTSFAPGLGSMVADSTRMQQVIWNLLTNAVKFTPAHGKAEVSARRTASQIEIVVTDDGEGIDPEFLPHVFQPFRQAELAKTRVHGGLGLGLSIVRYIVEAHAGSVTAESEGRGKGATFTVTLPLRAVIGDPDEAMPGGEPFRRAERLRGLEIVVVDDDSETRRMITAVLDAAGASVLPFPCATEALEAIDRRQPSIVLTDIAMPDVDGYAFARMLRCRDYGERLKVVALSAFPVSAAESRIFDLYLSKPIDPFQLIDEVARVALPPDVPT